MVTAVVATRWQDPAPYVSPFTPAHMHALLAGQGKCVAHPEMGRAVTLWAHHHPLACFGITQLWAGLGIAWMEDAGEALVTAYRGFIARAVLTHWRFWTQGVAFRRIESYVPESHARARGLVEHLGFTLLARKPHYAQDGGTTLEYVWYASGYGEE